MELECESETKTCVICSQIKVSSAFETNRKQCRDCRQQQKTEYAKQRVIPEGQVPNLGPCRGCNKAFDPANPAAFKYRSDLQKYSSMCVEWYNSKKYYQKYRETKRAEDELAYLENQAATHLAYVHKRNKSDHPIEKNTANRSVNQKMSQIKSSATSRHILWSAHDESKMRAKLLDDCVYCGESVADSNILRGLDRVDNTVGYTDANTVACCNMCNMMKGVYPVTLFINKIKQIAAHQTSLASKDNTNEDTTEEKEQDETNIETNNDKEDEPNNDKEDKEQEAEDQVMDTTAFRQKRRRLVHRPEEQGIRVSFVNKHNGKIAHITNTIKEAAELIGNTATNGTMKLRNPEAIWVQPHWTAQHFHECDTIDESEQVAFQTALAAQCSARQKKNKNELCDTKPKLFLQLKDNPDAICFDKANELAKYLNMPVPTLCRWLAHHNYKEQNVSFSIGDGNTITVKHSKLS